MDKRQIIRADKAAVEIQQEHSDKLAPVYLFLSKLEHTEEEINIIKKNLPDEFIVKTTEPIKRYVEKSEKTGDGKKLITQREEELRLIFVTYPDEMQKSSIILPRMFIPRAFSFRSKYRNYEETQKSGDEFPKFVEVEKIPEKDYSPELIYWGNKISKEILSNIKKDSNVEYEIIIRVPQENEDRPVTNQAIKFLLKNIVEKELERNEINATVKSEIVFMTTTHLANLLTDENVKLNFEEIKKQLIEDCHIKNNIKLFVNDSPNPELINKNFKMYELANKIIKAKNAKELALYLSETGEEVIFFPNHIKSNEITKAYDTLRYVGVAKKEKIYLDTDTGYINIKLEKDILKRDLDKVYSKISEQKIEVLYPNKKEEFKFRIIGDRGVLVDRQGNPLNIYELLHENGQSLIIKKDGKEILKVVIEKKKNEVLIEEHLSVRKIKEKLENEKKQLEEEYKKKALFHAKFVMQPVSTDNCSKILITPENYKQMLKWLEENVGKVVLYHYEYSDGTTYSYERGFILNLEEFKKIRNKILDLFELTTKEHEEKIKLLEKNVELIQEFTR